LFNGGSRHLSTIDSASTLAVEVCEKTIVWFVAKPINNTIENFKKLVALTVASVFMDQLL
jgi:hypothetical protein